MEWDGASWAVVATTGPSSRINHAMAYDPGRGRTVLFGGEDTSGNGSYLQPLEDTWEWDGTAWVQVASAGPGERAFHAMAHDSRRGRTVLFGGSVYSPVPDAELTTWEWDGATWAQVATTGPSARANHAMAFDSARGRTVLFGGTRGQGPLGDTWEWDGTVWEQVGAPDKLLRWAPALAYDESVQLTMLFGGSPSGPTEDPPSVPGDLWGWDGHSWARLESEGPAGRLGHAMVYDSGRGRLVLFGGETYLPDPTLASNVETLGDTWEYPVEGSGCQIAAGRASTEALLLLLTLLGLGCARRVHAMRRRAGR
jgi:hypothetical protein